MDKELIDKAWACLPREFKEKVKKEYARCVKIDVDDNPNLPAYAVKSAISRRALLEKLFGEHNLTSDAEGEEELLTVHRSKVIDIFTQNTILLSEGHSEYLSGYYNGKCHVLKDLFGSKYLPDELNEDNFAKSEPKPSEPKEDKHFDNILKDSFRDHNRLHIAAILAAGMLASEVRCYPVDRALELADKLIAECKKGDNHA